VAADSNIKTYQATANMADISLAKNGEKDFCDMVEVARIDGRRIASRSSSL
jgi:hypothetical protein